MIQHLTDHAPCDGCRQVGPLFVRVQYDRPYPAAGYSWGKLCKSCATCPPQSYRLISVQGPNGWVNVEHRGIRCEVGRAA